jgi:hypothetical protein
VPKKGGDFIDDIFGGNDLLEDPFAGAPAGKGSSPPPPPPPAPPPPPPPGGSASASSVVAPRPPVAPGTESELVSLVAQAVAKAPGLYAQLLKKADLGAPEGASDDATKVAAIRRAGLADLPPEKLRALIARAH